MTEPKPDDATREAIRRRAREIADSLPDLTPEQKARLRTLLRPARPDRAA